MKYAPRAPIPSVVEGTHYTSQASSITHRGQKLAIKHRPSCVEVLPVLRNTAKGELRRMEVPNITNRKSRIINGLFLLFAFLLAVNFCNLKIAYASGGLTERLDRTRGGLAEVPSMQWQKTYGGAGSDCGRSVQQTCDGGYIITGDTCSFGAGDNDVYLIKTDPNANLIWQKTFGGANYDAGYCVQQTSDRGFIIAGKTRSFETGPDFYLIKTNLNGNMLWQKTFGDANDAGGYFVQQTADHGYIVVGTTKSPGALNYDVYLIKTDPNGNMLWQKTFGDANDEGGYCIQQTANGGYIIAGTTYLFAPAYSDIYLIKTDQSANLIWQKTFYSGASNWNTGYSVQLTSDGGYIIGGETLYLQSDNIDVYLVKTDSAANLIWQKTFGGANYDYGYCVQQTSDSGFIIAGTTDSFGAGAADVYLIRTDPAGNLIWQKTFGGANYDYGYCVQQTTDGGYIIAGETASFGADADVYLIKLAGQIPYP